MAIKELFDSCEMHITKEGSNFYRHFVGSPTEINDGLNGDGSLPLVGDSWSADRPDVRVTDVRVRWVSNQAGKVEVMYSTRGGMYRDEIVDSITSVRHSFDFSMTMQSGADFKRATKTTEGTPPTEGYYSRNWQNFWTAEGKSGTAPDLNVYRPILTWTVRCYCSNWNFVAIKNLFGAVNSNDFLKQWMATWRLDDYVGITGDDTGQWLFAGFNANQIAEGKYELVLTFLFSEDGIDAGTSGDRKGWNFPHGIENNADIYKERDFNALPLPQDNKEQNADGVRA